MPAPAQGCRATAQDVKDPQRPAQPRAGWDEGAAGSQMPGSTQRAKERKAKPEKTKANRPKAGKGRKGLGRWKSLSNTWPT